MTKVPTEQQLVRRVVRLAKDDQNDEGGNKRRKKIKTGKMWVRYVDDEVGLSDPMKRVVKRQGISQNRPKPIGLYLGHDELVKLQDRKKAHDSSEAKRQSFIESFQFHAEGMDSRSQISSAVVIPAVTNLLRKSSLKTPRVDHLDQYVEKHYRKCRNENTTTRRQF